MNLYKFIDSKAIRNHLEELKYEFSPNEAAFLVWQSEKNSLSEKHKAWQWIIDNMDDMNVFDSIADSYLLQKVKNDKAFLLLHDYLKDYMEVENKLIKKGQSTEEKTIFSFELYYKGDNDRCEDRRLFLDFESCMDAVRKEREETEDYELAYIYIKKQWINTEERFITLRFYPDFTLHDIYGERNVLSDTENYILNIFSDMWFYIPTPFKKGDIVYCGGDNGGEYPFEKEPFVLDYICHRDIEKPDFNIKEAQQRHAWCSMDMTAYGYFLNDDGTLYYECMHNYLSIDYYDDIKDEKNVLKALSSYLKGKIDVDTLMEAYRIIEIYKNKKEIYIMKIKKILSLLLTFGVICTNVAYTKDYSDYPQKYWDLDKSHWAYSYISELTDKKVIEGFEDGSFKPDKTVTRAEWSKLICIASGKTLSSSDVTYAIDYKTSDWYSSYVNTIKDYINFYKIDNEYYFKPNQAITREDVTVSLVKLKGYDLSDVDYSNITKFSDFNSISNSLKVYISVAISNELIKGFEDNTFRGQDTLTRAEAATLLCRAFQLGDINKGTEYSTYDELEEETDTNSEDYYKEYYSDLINQNKNNASTNISKNETVKESEDKSDSSKNDEKYKYELNTLVSAKTISIETKDLIKNIDYNFYYTVHDDILYYFDKTTNEIIKFDIYKKQKETLININEIEIEHNDINYKGYNLKGLFYDTYSDTLVLNGYFINKKFDKETKFSCILELNTMNIISNIGKISDLNSYGNDCSILDYIKIYGTKNNGDYLVNATYDDLFHDSTISQDYIINRNSYKFTAIDGVNDFFIPYYETKNDIYYIDYTFSELCLTNKDFSKDEYITDMLTCVGISDNSCYTINESSIIIYDFNGNESEKINFNEIDIIDDRGFNNYSYDRLFFITSKNDMVFFDNDNLSFRMISRK